MPLELLNGVNVFAYLIEQGIIKAGEKTAIDELTGGVSNTVLAITTKTRNLVLKQALPELKVAQKWEADQRRAIVEADALRLFHKLSPRQVPKLVFIDPVNYVLIMERTPLNSTLWKTDLLDGIYDAEVSRVLGRTLATWHRFGAENPEHLTKFKEDKLFEQLRIDPFYRFVANRNPLLRKSIGRLIDELEVDHNTIVHGDFSPKNIMVSASGEVYILDFEVTHVGNPVFDLAFLLAHLLCKFFRAKNSSDTSALAMLAQEFVHEYEMVYPISPSLVQHTALIALARVEGKSPVDYLNPNQQERLSVFTKTILSQGEPIDILALFDRSAK